MNKIVIVTKGFVILNSIFAEKRIKRYDQILIKVKLIRVTCTNKTLKWYHIISIGFSVPEIGHF